MSVLDAAFVLRDATVGVGNVFRDTVVRFCLSLSTVIVLSWVAISMYVSFYYAYMPTIHHSQPVFLEFSSDCAIKPENGLCSFPEANVSLSKGERILMRGQRYQVYLDLEMPQSPVNEKLGMFMINLKFLSNSGKVVATSSRSSMLHFRSGFLKAINTMFMSFPLIFGFSEEKQNVAVKMFDNYVDDSYHPVTKINVIILAKHIEIYTASIRIEAEFSGLRYILFRWPILSALVCISANFIVTCMVFFFAYHAFSPDPSEREPESAQVSGDQLYSEARRRDLRQNDPRIPRPRSPSPQHNTGRLLTRNSHTRTKEPNVHPSTSTSSTAPVQLDPSCHRLRSASFPSCRSEADDLDRVASSDVAETVCGAPSPARGDSEEMHLGVEVGRDQMRSDSNDTKYECSRGYQSSPEVDTVQPLTYSQLKDTDTDISEGQIIDKKSREMAKSLSLDSGVQQILPSFTIVKPKKGEDSLRQITSTGDIDGHSSHVQDSAARQIPDGAPADGLQTTRGFRVAAPNKGEDQCSSIEEEKTSARKRATSKTRSKFGSPFKKMMPRK